MKESGFQNERFEIRVWKSPVQCKRLQWFFIKPHRPQKPHLANRTCRNHDPFWMPCKLWFYFSKQRHLKRKPKAERSAFKTTRANCQAYRLRNSLYESKHVIWKWLLEANLWNRSVWDSKSNEGFKEKDEFWSWVLARFAKERDWDSKGSKYEAIMSSEGPYWESEGNGRKAKW